MLSKTTVKKTAPINLNLNPFFQSKIVLLISISAYAFAHDNAQQFLLVSSEQNSEAAYSASRKRKLMGTHQRWSPVE